MANTCGVWYLGRASGPDLFDEQLYVRAALRDHDDIGWVIISTGILVSFLFEDFFGVVSGDLKTMGALGSWQNIDTVTDAENIGKLTAEVSWDGDVIRNEVVFIAGNTISDEGLAEAV
jgi:hypothetical protein